MSLLSTHIHGGEIICPVFVMSISTDPDLTLPMGLAFGGVTVLFIISVIVYYVFKVDIVLWFRRAFPILYTNTGNITLQVFN